MKRTGLPNLLTTRWNLSLVMCGLSLALYGCGGSAGPDPAEYYSDKVKRNILRDGEGLIAKPGKVVQLHYIRYTDSGNVFLDTRDRGRPHTFTIGDRSTFQGLDLAVRGMQPGSVWEVRIPPDMHGGMADFLSEQHRPVSHTPVVYKIEMMNVQDPYSFFGGPPKKQNEQFIYTTTGMKVIEGED